ncbi:signal peptidase II [Candidatus Woesearchaeota archaeon]|jgi:signal peptidase II|nr:signal peptidase II [Candidatus Woesearchaeota archaeon]MBT4368436.1 signal peptidase II [Candidatus Woesearchaeota archaeon]MBT4712925.1 signal peptidase II [Candidatus Woesearchaeota archaeon]MBT6639837.1 signal peptidase II [Candidatus Woesearchaeota archaeon]MBT7134009.1 signal peptidase II [Candidatus Woesearchaeota archaeon]
MKEDGKFILFALLIIIVDIITKQLIVIFNPNLKLLPFFSLIYVKNTGAGFGILSGMNVLLIVISVLVLVGIGYYYKKIPKESWVLVASGLITGGIVGNLIDRVFRGFVVDFLDFFVSSWHWPAFNVADSALVIGVVILIIYYWKK